MILNSLGFIFLLLPVSILGQTDTQETTLQNPAFVNPAPCPCDLTANQYDNNCCCDLDASQFPEEISISSCIQGNHGGDFSFTDDNICKNNLSYTLDWFPFTCIQFLNSPSLGLYYYPAISKEPDNLVTDPYLYDPEPSNSVSNAVGYSYGDALVVNIDAGVTVTSSAYYLTMPQESLDGNCITRSPIQYLVGSSSSCDVTVDAVSCGSGTKLDHNMYIPTAGFVQVPTVEYLCASSNDVLFVTTNTGTEPASTSLFDSSPVTGEPVGCVAADVRRTGTVCNNAVAAVSYVFTWNNTAIVDFKITITLINASFTEPRSTVDGTGPNYVLTQQFRTTFIPSNATNAQPQSGNPGYELGLPVISGVAEGGIVNTTAGLKIWKPASTGLCADATQASPVFGYDVITGCNLVFGYYNCTLLRILVEDQQTQLINATLVSRFGNPSTSASSVDWLEIISNLSESNVTESEYSCEGIPSRLNLEFLWAKSGEQDGQPIREIVGVKSSWTRETWEIKCVEGDNLCPVSFYTIYSSASFTEVPAQTPTPQTTYELSRNDSCREDATCWTELLLPFQSEFFYQFDIDTADILRAYNFRWGIVITFLSVAAALVPAHWSSVGRYLKQVLPI